MLIAYVLRVIARRAQDTGRVAHALLASGTCDDSEMEGRAAEERARADGQARAAQLTVVGCAQSKRMSGWTWKAALP